MVVIVITVLIIVCIVLLHQAKEFVAHLKSRMWSGAEVFGSSESEVMKAFGGLFCVYIAFSVCPDGRGPLWPYWHLCDLLLLFLPSQKCYKLFNIEKILQGVYRSVMACKAFAFFWPSAQATQMCCISIWEVKAEFSAAAVLCLYGLPRHRKSLLCWTLVLQSGGFESLECSDHPASQSGAHQQMLQMWGSHENCTLSKCFLIWL